MNNKKIAVVLAALASVTMAFSACGDKNSSSSKTDASSAASSAAESTAAAEESKADAAPAESTAAAESKADDNSNDAGEVDVAALTGNTWITAQMIKEDGSNIDMEAYANEVGATMETVVSNIAFTADGKYYLINTQTGAVQGTYAVNGKKITVTPSIGNPFDLEMGESDGTKMLAQEFNPPQNGYKGVVFGINSKVSIEDILAKFGDGEQQGAEGGEQQAAEGGEQQAAEGGEQQAAEGGEQQAAEGGEEQQAAEGGEQQAAEGGEEAAE